MNHPYSTAEKNRRLAYALYVSFLQGRGTRIVTLMNYEVRRQAIDLWHYRPR